MTTVLTCTLLSLCSAVVLASYSGKVLIISMDGFRYDYLDLIDTPYFDTLAKTGVKLPYMTPSFIPKTFPSHYTMVTGLYEESHGITANAIYDPEFNETFTMRIKETKWWEGGEPIWVTAKKQGLKTGSYFWPGNAVEIQGIRPDYWFPYKQIRPFRARVDTVVDWFKNKGVQLVTLYFYEPDTTGHFHGPNSTRTSFKVQEMDYLLGYIMKKLKENGLEEEVNMIVTADHGMAEVDVVNRVLDINDLVDMTKVDRIPSVGPVMQILPKDGQIDAIVDSLKNVEHITVYKKEDIPERFHYKNNRRIMPIVIMADEGWQISKDKAALAKTKLKGAHGYDNNLMSMKTIFLARGPNFKVNFKSDPIESVDLYPLMCKLLNINPSPNNGSLDRVSAFIRHTPDVMRTSASGSITSQIAVIIGIVFFSVLTR